MTAAANKTGAERTLSERHRSLLALFKESGPATVPVLAQVLGLNIEAVREHLVTLRARGLVERRSTRADGPGRPAVVYGLTDEAESLFPRHEAEVLRELAAFLRATGREQLLDEFFDRYIERRREAALERLRGLPDIERLQTAAAILSEQGFIAVVDDNGTKPVLRLCHCPLRELVTVSKVPCRAEAELVRSLLGDGYERVSYIPAGDGSCSYREEGSCRASRQAQVAGSNRLVTHTSSTRERM